MPWRDADDPHACVDLSDAEYHDVWDQVYSTLGFKPSVKPESWPSFREPSGSTTWNSVPLFADLERTELEVAARLRESLDAVRGDDDFVYALDWQHPGYRFNPALASPPQRLDSWLVPALPDGDYYLFLARDLRFGWLGHPWEQSVCVFGELVGVVTPALANLGVPILRQKP